MHSRTNGVRASDLFHGTSILICHPELIKGSFPWLWEMKELISERPNVTPVGLGNGNSTIDMSIYSTGYSSENDGSWKVEATDVDEIELGFDEEGDEDEIRDGGIKDEDDDDIKDKDITVTVPRKRTANPVTKKTGARPGNSNPARSDSKKLKVTDKFAEVANAEEVTAQKTLKLQKIQAQGNVVKIKAKADAQMQRDRLKAEARMMAKKQEHEYRMAQLNLQLMQGPAHPFSQAGPSASTYHASPGPSRSQYNLDNLNDFAYNPSFDNALGLPSLPPVQGGGSGLN